MFCSKCGHVNDGNAKFCEVCGGQLLQTQVESSREKPKINGFNLAAIVFSFIAVILCGITLIDNCLGTNDLFHTYGLDLFEDINPFVFYQRFFSLSTISILLAFCIAFSQKNAKSIPLAFGVEEFCLGLIPLVYGALVLEENEPLNIIAIFFNILILLGTLIWLIKPEKSWISSIIIAISACFFISYRIYATEYDWVRTAVDFGSVCLYVSVVLKGFSSSKSNGKFKQVNTPVFWIITSCLSVFYLIGYFINVA